MFFGLFGKKSHPTPVRPKQEYLPLTSASKSPLSSTTSTSHLRRGDLTGTVLCTCGHRKKIGEPCEVCDRAVRKKKEEL